jgi:hypothetical protein
MDFLKLSLIDLLKKADNSELVLPNFQREYVWKLEQQKLLIASFLVNLPIGTFLILDGDKDDFISKPLCFNKQATPLQNCLFLLDGQQRLSTIKSAFSDLLNFNDWQINFDDLFYLLRNKWYLDLKEESCRECLGFEKLNFKQVITIAGSKVSVPILSIKEPGDILDAIKIVQIFKGSRKDTKFHPGRTFSPNSTSEFDKKNELATLFATDTEIPLFDFLNEKQTIIKNTLKLIASIRLNVLKDEVLEDAKNNYAKSCLYLQHLDDNIQSKYINANWREIDLIWDTLKDNWVEDILEYFKDLFKSELMIPNIKSNELSRATSVFEFMNKGGTPLDSFDIMVAKFAQVGAQNTLYEKLKEIITKDFQIPASVTENNQISYNCENFGVFSNNTISKHIKEIFLNFISINTIPVINDIELSNIKKDKILSLNKTQIDGSLFEAEKALQRSLSFLQFRCGFHNYNLLSYNLMLLPIGMLLKDDAVWNDRNKVDKIEYWYWTSLFSGRYREKQNQRSIQDIKELYKWVVQDIDSVDIKTRKSKIFLETNYSDEKTLLLQNDDKSVPTAIYNGILQYVLSGKPSDFTLNTTKLIPWDISANRIVLEDHHIIPLGSVTTINESSKQLRSNKSNVLNSPLNRTYITRIANQQISSLSLDRYLPILNNSITHSQFIPNGPYNQIPSDRAFQESFIKARFDLIKREILNELNRLVP